MTKLIDQVKELSRKVFAEKNSDYGPSWLLFRFPSLIDQMWIKILRIRSIEEHQNVTAVEEGRDVEYLGLINYAITALMKLNHGDILPDSEQTLGNLDLLQRVDEQKLLDLYDRIFEETKHLLLRKNNDYSDAWKKIEITSITDLILVKLVRIKHIVKQDQALKASEGVESQLYDIINYAIFALIRLGVVGEDHVPGKE